MTKLGQGVEIRARYPIYEDMCKNYGKEKEDTEREGIFQKIQREGGKR